MAEPAVQPTDLPAPVRAVCDCFLRVVPPGLVTGLHLRGGVGFGEWWPGQSDVDFVAVLDHAPDPAETEALRVAHEQVRSAYPDPAPWLSGVHVLADDLQADPRTLPPRPTVLEGVFDPAGETDALVAWHELARHGVTVLGPPIAGLGVWTDQDALLAHTRANLDTYWRGWADRLRDVVVQAPPDHGGPELAAAAERWVLPWCALGAPRLHHLLVTGEMTTKSRAGRWALETYPETQHAALLEALRVREGLDGPDPYVGDDPRRVSATLAVLEHAVAAAQEPATRADGPVR